MSESPAAEAVDIAALVRQAQAGDTGARERLFAAHAALALRLAIGLCRGRRAEAEDLAQDALATCARRLAEVREPARFAGWLVRTVRNLHINRFHATAAANRLEERVALEGDGTAVAVDPFEAFAAEQRAEIVKAALARLEDGPAKAAAILYYMEGDQATADVAEKLGVPQSTVTTWLDRFRRRMRKELLLTLVERARPGAPGHTVLEDLR